MGCSRNEKGAGFVKVGGSPMSPVLWVVVRSGVTIFKGSCNYTLVLANH